MFCKQRVDARIRASSEESVLVRAHCLVAMRLLRSSSPAPPSEEPGGLASASGTSSVCEHGGMSALVQHSLVAAPRLPSFQGSAARSGSCDLGGAYVSGRLPCGCTPTVDHVTPVFAPWVFAFAALWTDGTG